MHLVPLLIAAVVSAHAGRMGPFLDEVGDTADLAPERPACEEWRLPDGVQLPERNELYSRWKPHTAWGTPYLIDTLESAAEEVATQLPYVDPVAIGDLSRKGGGTLYGHMTHNTGLDADIGFFLDDGRQPSNGTFEDATASSLDKEATWTLIRALLDTGRVQFILLDENLIRALRRWLAAEGVLDPESIDRIFPPSGSSNWKNSGYVTHAAGHQNHLHVRVMCE